MRDDDWFALGYTNQRKNRVGYSFAILGNEISPSSSG